MNKMSSEQIAIDMERALFDAIKTRDLHKLRQIVAEDLVFRNAGGPSVGREEFLKIVNSFPGEILSVDSDNLEARVFADTAIVTGTQHATVRHPDGQEESGDTLFTDVFMKRGEWRLVYAHTVDLPNSTADSKK